MPNKLLPVLITPRLSILISQRAFLCALPLGWATAPRPFRATARLKVAEGMPWHAYQGQQGAARPRPFRSRAATDNPPKGILGKGPAPQGAPLWQGTSLLASPPMH